MWQMSGWAKIQTGPKPTCLTIMLHPLADHMAENGQGLLGEGEYERRLKENMKLAQYQRKDPKRTQTDSKVVTLGLVSSGSR